MGDHSHRDHTSLIRSFPSTADVGFNSLSRDRRSSYFPPLGCFPFASTKDYGDGDGNGLFFRGKLLLPLSFLKNGQWLDYRRLQGHRRSNQPSRETSDCGCSTSGATLEIRSWPKWYRLLMIGSSRVSSKMELEDMRKRRIVRQCPGDGEGKDGFRKITAGWKVMSVLSCNGFSSVAVAPSIACVPPQPC